MALAGPRQSRNCNFFDSSALVASKNLSSSSIALAGSRRMSCRSPSKGERPGTTNTRSLRSFLPFDDWTTSSTPDDEDIERIAVLGFSGRDEAPIVGIGQPREQRLRERERTELGIKLQLGATAARCFNHGIDMVTIGPRRQFGVIGHIAATVYPLYPPTIGSTSPVM